MIRFHGIKLQKDLFTVRIRLIAEGSIVFFVYSKVFFLVFKHNNNRLSTFKRIAMQLVPSGGDLGHQSILGV